MSNSELLTVIITASLIPSHPSIKIIQKTIESLQIINIPGNTKIILAHDYSNNDNYIEYFEKLNNYIKPFTNIEIVKRDTHGHLVGNIRNALKYVTSKFILLIQHDLFFITKFDIQKVICDMEENINIKYIRFNKRKNIKKGWDGRNNLFGLQQKQKHYTYTRTPCWSDNNHLCLTTYYTDIIMKESKDGFAMEHTIHGKIKNQETHNKYGTYLFGKLNYQQVIDHSDGRNTK